MLLYMHVTIVGCGANSHYPPVSHPVRARAGGWGDMLGGGIVSGVCSVVLYIDIIMWESWRVMHGGKEAGKRLLGTCGWRPSLWLEARPKFYPTLAMTVAWALSRHGVGQSAVCSVQRSKWIKLLQRWSAGSNLTLILLWCSDTFRCEHLSLGRASSLWQFVCVTPIANYIYTCVCPMQPVMLTPCADHQIWNEDMWLDVHL